MSNLDFKPIAQLQIKPVAFQAAKDAVRAEIVFGIPGKNCDGVGICKILSIENVYVKWKCLSARGWLSLTPEGILQIAFDLDRLSPECYLRYFQAGIFRVEEAYPLPAEVLACLKLDAYLIEPGEYTVQVSDGFLKIEL